ncbi:MAG TPA: ATP-binding protein [Gemmatimonadaceae bacterium]|nr:ATP-binding protein [Gemmatimonadaceae bacterium]
MASRLPILVVDDDVMMVRTIGDILRFRGYDPIAASSGREGLEFTRQRPDPPAIALVDLKLPDMDGMQLVSELRSIAPLLEVLILTGYASVESAVAALREHSYDYLVKPVAPEHLVTSIARAGDRWQRRHAEVMLEESELRLRRMFECVSDAVFITDDDKRIIDANPAAVALVARSVEALRGQPLDVLLAPVLPYVDVRASAFAPGMHVHSVRDLSEQRRLEGVVRHAQKMEAVGRLAGGIAHDFNNVLTAITGFTSILRKERPEGDPDRPILEEILGAANRGATLTRQLLAFSRKQTLNPRRLDVNETIRGIENILQRLLGDELELRLQLADDLAFVHADPGQIEQVLLNLVVNARDAMEPGGCLSVVTSNMELVRPGSMRSGTFVVMDVCDTGAGMSSAVMEQIFEPFFTTKPEGKGTGLGLSIVHGIIEQSGGFVQVQSEAGAGTRFRVALPRYEIEADLARA